MVKLKVLLSVVAMSLVVGCGGGGSSGGTPSVPTSKIFDFGDGGIHYGYETDGVALASVVNNSETLLYVADDYNGLVILDISDVENIKQVGHLSSTNAVDLKLNVDGTKIFLADSAGGLKVINVQDPTNPTLVKTFSLGNVTSVKLNTDNSRIYLNTHLIDYDASNDAIIFSTAVGMGKADSITSDDTKKYNFGSTSFISISDGYDITDLSNITTFPQYLDGATVSDITTDGNTIYYYDSTTSNLWKKDTPDSSSPSKVNIPTPTNIYKNFTNFITLSDDDLNLFLLVSNDFIGYDLRPTTPLMLFHLNTGDIELQSSTISPDVTRAYISAGVDGIIVLDVANVPQ